MPQEIIRVENFSYIYEDTEDYALQNVSFSVEEGDFVGVIGPNKAGKSTLCQALVGVLPFVVGGKWDGSISIGGKDLALTGGVADAGAIGIVFQDAESQFTQETVEDEIAFAMCNFGYPRELMVQRVQQAAEACGLTALLHRSPFKLSGGQQQRLAVACILALQPRIIVLDETTSQLDPLGRDEVFGLITQLHRQGNTIIMVDHNIEKIAQYANKVLLLHQGQRKLFGPAQQVFEQADELARCQVRVPQVTQAALALQPRLPGQVPIELNAARSYFAPFAAKEDTAHA